MNKISVKGYNGPVSQSKNNFQTHLFFIQVYDGRLKIYYKNHHNELFIELQDNPNLKNINVKFSQPKIMDNKIQTQDIETIICYFINRLIEANINILRIKRYIHLRKMSEINKEYSVCLAKKSLKNIKQDSLI